MYLNTSNFWAYTQGLLLSKKFVLSYFHISIFTNNKNDIKSILNYTEEELNQSCYYFKKKHYIKINFLRKQISLLHFLVYFPTRNPNQGKNIEELFYEVYSEFDFDLTHQLLLVNHLQKSFRRHLKQSIYCFIEIKSVKGDK